MEGKKIFGEKDSFAIEIYNPIVKRTKICIWLNNFLIGNCQEEEYLLQVLNRLIWLVNSKELKSFHGKFENWNILSLINDESLENQIIFNIGESFDDFIIRVLGNKDFICFYWKLVDDPYFTYNQDINILYSHKILWDEFEKVIKDIYYYLNKNST